MHEFWKHIAIGGAFVGTAVLCSGAVNPWDDGKEAVLVEETTYIIFIQIVTIGHEALGKFVCLSFHATV